MGTSAPHGVTEPSQPQVALAVQLCASSPKEKDVCGNPLHVTLPRSCPGWGHPFGTQGGDTHLAAPLSLSWGG